jgi:diaminohydroxyphosphoribosylaminopyrimidine deaminase/5-amino-6-(5-phosphoribosylamino)uracil reductase
MSKVKNKKINKHSFFIRLAFQKAEINLGSTGTNPSVGCVVEKDGSVISTGMTSINGRPHAEFNSLNKKINFKGSNLYVTLEPCTHKGLSNPCTDVIIKKKIKNVFFPIFDIDKRTAKKSVKILNKNKIKVEKGILKNSAIKFYKSYFDYKKKLLPLIDAKIAISKDFFTKDKKNKWITNIHSRKRVHLLRSKYNCIISTSKSINEDNSLLNCRIEGMEHKSPDLIIIDRYLILRKDLNIFNNIKKRKIFIFTKIDNKKRLIFFKKKGIKIIIFKDMNIKKDYTRIFSYIHNLGYSRIFIESGLTFLSYLLDNKFINNLYTFKSRNILGKNGFNHTSSGNLKKMNLGSKVDVNLFEDLLYQVKIK